MDELEIKEMEYRRYIDEHLFNVKLAFEQYKDLLCKALNVSVSSLGELIQRHDQSKFEDIEFDAYRNWFYPCDGEERDKDLFDEAWEHHYLNNPHHPQYWVRENYIEDMPPIYIAEMLIDWQAMKIKFGGNNYEYYLQERDKKPFSENTKKILDVVVKEVFGE